MLVFIVEESVWKQSAVRIVINYNVLRARYVAVVDILLSAAVPKEMDLGVVRSHSFLYLPLLPIMPVITLACILRISPISRVK
jgi:hypothetical protein